MTLRSRICRGTVTHQRLHPVSHTFTYPSTFFGFDLSELDRIAEQATIFSHNGINLLSLNDRDYLHGKNAPIIQQLDSLLAPEKEDEYTLLVSSPRYFGYAFNPVNFHLRMANGQLLSVVAEVNNTFGDRHVYALEELTRTANNTWNARRSKAFHVSPFNNMNGEYHFTFKIDSQHLYMGVDLHRDGQCVLKTWLEGISRPITNTAILKYALLHPFDTAFNSMPRILWQAALLHYKKHLQVYTRPSPISENTLLDRDEKGRPDTVI
jgi:DUF1365 family protein